MAFFKFRKAGGDASGAAVQTESVEVLRRRARHRLIGAAVLVGIAVIGFPLLFDTQPRPVSVDIAIDIPDRDKARPLSASSAAVPAPPPAPATAAVAAPKPAASTAVAAAPAAMAASEALGPREEILPRKPASAAAPASSARSAAGTVSGGAVAEPKPASTRPAEPRPAASKPAEPKAAESKAAEAKPAEPRPAARTDDGAKALALLEGKQPEAAAERYVVQVGAFAEPDKAREVRLKLERAGLKTYTHVAETKEGKRIRVRVGPFEKKAEADKAAERIKALDLPAAILTL